MPSVEFDPLREPLTTSLDLLGESGFADQELTSVGLLHLYRGLPGACLPFQDRGVLVTDNEGREGALLLYAQGKSGTALELVVTPFELERWAQLVAIAQAKKGRYSLSGSSTSHFA